MNELYPQKIPHVQSPTDINWNRPLDEQLEPQLSGQPTSKRSAEDLRVIRNRVPKLIEEQFFNLKEAATWILSGIQWFNVLEQPMMIVIWEKNWRDAAKFQYLLQILQVNLEDYIPKWQIFVEQDNDFPKMILKWRFLSTVWTGQPVMGFMAETDFENAQGQLPAEVDFNPCGPFQPHPSRQVEL